MEPRRTVCAHGLLPTAVSSYPTKDRWKHTVYKSIILNVALWLDAHTLLSVGKALENQV